jgi:hypothetical protein
MFSRTALNLNAANSSCQFFFGKLTAQQRIKKKLSGRGAAEILLAAAAAGKKTGCRKDNSRDSPIPCADSV